MKVNIIILILAQDQHTKSKFGEKCRLLDTQRASCIAFRTEIIPILKLIVITYQRGTLSHFATGFSANE